MDAKHVAAKWGFIRQKEPLIARFAVPMLPLPPGTDAHSHSYVQLHGYWNPLAVQETYGIQTQQWLKPTCVIDIRMSAVAVPASTAALAKQPPHADTLTSGPLVYSQMSELQSPPG